MNFPKATTYQVKVEQIAQITKLGFHVSGVNLPYQQTDSREIVYKRIEVERSTDKGLEELLQFRDEPLDYKLDGISL